MKIIIHDTASHQFVFQLSKELAKRHHTVYHVYSTAFQSPNRGNLSSLIDLPHLHLVPIDIGKEYSKTNLLNRRYDDILYGRAIIEKIKDIKPDILINSVSQLDSSKLIFKECKNNNIQYITWLQDIYSIAIENILKKKIPFFGKLIVWYYKYIESMLLKESTKIIAITENFLPLLESWDIGREKISIIPNWADIEKLPICSKNNTWSISHDLHDKFCFLYSGTLGFKHNPEFLFKLALKYRYNPEVRIVVISEGQGADWLKKEISKTKIQNLIVLNYQPLIELPKVLATGDVLISILESDASMYSVPSKVLSYFCAMRSLLLAVPSQNLSASIVLDIECGLVVSPDDINAFLNASEKLFRDESMRSKYGQNARKYAEENFHINTITNKFINAIY